MRKRITRLICTALNSRYVVFVVIATALVLPRIPAARTLLFTTIMVLLYINFLSIRITHTTFFDRYTTFYIFFVLLVYPAIMYLLSGYLPFSLYTGLLSACISPTATASPVMSDLIKADNTRVLSHVLLVNIIAPLTYGIIIFFSFHSRQITIPYLHIMFTVAILVLLPLLLARITNILFPASRGIGAKPAKKTLFLFLVFVSVSSASRVIKTTGPLLLLGIFLTTFVLALTLYGTGYCTGRDRRERKTASLMFGHKNIGLSMMVVLANFDAQSAIPLVLYILSHHLINGFLIARHGDRRS